MSSALHIDPNTFQRHADRTADRSVMDLYVQAWLDDQATVLMESMVSFFQFKESPTGELVMRVFGSGVLVSRRDKVLVVTALSVVEQFGHGETYMQTAMGAVSMRGQTIRSERCQGIAVCDVDKIVRVNAVLPPWTMPVVQPGVRKGSTSVLCLGYPGTASAFRKSRRPSSFEVKAVMVPYCGGNFIRTSMEQPLFLEWGRKSEIPGFGRSDIDVDLDPKGMIGGPVFEIVTDSQGETSSRLLAVTVEYRRDHGVVVCARSQTIEPIMDLLLDRGGR